MGFTKICLVTVAVVLLSARQASSAGTTSSVASRSGSGGKEFFQWLGKQLPELILKVGSCMKRNERELTGASSALFADVGKCFDDSQGSVTGTLECLLSKSSTRMLDTLGATKKVFTCVVKKAQDAHLCVSMISAKERETCSFSVGI